MTPHSLRTRWTSLLVTTNLILAVIVSLCTSASANTTPPVIYVSATTNGTASSISGDNIAYRNEDILAFDYGTGVWSLFIDGSDIGITGDINAFTLTDDGSILISLASAVSLTGLGQVDDSDILRFTPASTGETTAGTLELYFDGSDVGLTTAAEDIQALDVLDNGNIVISTVGNVNVPGVSATDSDLLEFSPTQLGSTTVGSWAPYFTGAEVELTTSGEDIWASSVDNNVIYISTYTNFSAGGITGNNTDILQCEAGSTGSVTNCNYSLFWSGRNNGLANININALHLELTGSSTNSTPVAVNDSYATQQDSDLLVEAPGLVSNDSDDDNDALSVSLTDSTSTANGTLTLNTDGSFTYQPQPGFSGTDSFSYRVTDGISVSDVASVDIEVTAISENNELIYVSSSTNGTVSSVTGGSVTYRDEDILIFDPDTSEWALFFDGSDVGITGDINAFALIQDNSILISLTAPATLAGIGRVDDSDIIRFVPASVGENTTGTIELYFDGSDVGLSSSAENIDALSVLDNGNLLLSTTGNVSAQGFSASDSDLIEFSAEQLGSDTAGNWSLYFRGADVQLTTSGEDIWASSVSGNNIYLNSLANFSIDAVSGGAVTGDSADIILCQLASVSACNYSIYWDGGLNGLSGKNIDGMSIGQSPSVFVNSAPVIEVWHGLNQQFELGQAQAWINIPGNVSDDDGISTLTYSLNGASEQNLSVGPDSQRLVAVGDFNVDLSSANLQDGTNQLQITAVDSLGKVATSTVAFSWDSNARWPDTYEVIWDQQSNIQEAAQIVDGNWSLHADGVRSGEQTYSRTFAIGDQAWSDYEVSSSFVLHSYNGSEFSGVGLVPRWQGHSDDPISGYQPKAGWLPRGEVAWMAYFTPSGASRSQVGGGNAPREIFSQNFLTEQPYDFKVRVSTDGGFTVYQVKVWERGSPEPVNWQLATTDNGNGPTHGSALFVTQYADATFGDLSIAPILTNQPPVAVDDFFSTGYETALSVTAANGVLANDTDNENDPLNAVLIASATNGTVTLSPDGSFNYTPSAGFSGIDSFTYMANDGSADSAGPALVEIAVSADLDMPTIDIWYGSNQQFGSVGQPQTFVNIPGNVSDPDGVASLTYSLNGGSAVALSIGPDGRRLNSSGDFNADIDTSLLANGTNQVLLTATDTTGNTSQSTVNFSYDGSTSWPINYNIDWSQVSDLQDVVQIVDGDWSVQNNSLRVNQRGYDRLVNIGDVSWTDYELVAKFTIHNYDSSDFAGVGVITRWSGHTDSPVAGLQPKSGWLPYGSVGWSAYFPPGGNSRMQVGGYQLPKIRKNFSYNIGQTYSFRYKTETLNGSDTQYSMKVWADGTAEPAQWGVEYTDITSGVTTGSILLIAHNSEVSFGDISVQPLTTGNTNNAPVAIDDNFATAFETPLIISAGGVLSNDSDSDNDPLTAVLASGPTNGTLTALNADGSFEYSPDSGFIGTDTFTYIANDTTENSVTAATVSITVNAPTTSSGLLAHLEFNDSQTPSIAADSSGNGNVGLIQGPVYTANSNDGSSHSMEFDGINDVVDLGPLNVPGTALTLAAWIKADSFPGSSMDPRIISKASGTSESAHTFMLSTFNNASNNTVLRARLRTDTMSATLIATTGVLSVDQWYHTALVYDGSAMTLYLNGAAIGTAPVNGAIEQNASSKVYIGANPVGGRHFDGLIDDVRILQRAMSATEVMALVGGGSAASPPANLRAVSLSNTYIDLTWSPSAGAASYNIYRDGQLIATTTDTSYRDDSFVATSGSSTFDYEVIAIDTDGKSSVAAQLTTSAHGSLAGSWWDASWGYRVRTAIGSANTDRNNKIATLPVDLDALLTQAGGTGLYDRSTVRCVETGIDGEWFDDTVRCQSEDGEVIIMMGGTTAADTVRYYHIYFDEINKGQVDTRIPLVSVTTGVQDESFDSIRIDTSNSTIYYHTEGAGISSFIDSSNLDWINFNTSTGGNGLFRGIPNLVPPVSGGYFHPGASTSTTSLISSGQIRTRLESQTNNSEPLWRVRMDIYPEHAELTVLEKPADNYWFLYEGTPGGAFDSGDSTVRSTGSATEQGVFNNWSSDIAGEEWVMFNASEVNRSLFVAKRDDDSHTDSYRPLTNTSGLMTVFGFGREVTSAQLTDSGEVFLFGFLETQNFGPAQAQIRSITRPLDSGISAPVSQP